MKQAKSYTSIWNVEKVLHALGDARLPFPVTFTQIAWFMVLLFLTGVFQDVPPLSFIDNALMKHFAVPAGITWFMSQKTFDGKKPYSFLWSVCSYAIRPKETYAGKPIKLSTVTVNEAITAVRSEVFEPENKISNEIH